jgi:hypothetical protein
MFHRSLLAVADFADLLHHRTADDQRQNTAALNTPRTQITDEALACTPRNMTATRDALLSIVATGQSLIKEDIGALEHADFLAVRDRP